jgi:peptidoglycan hydrolase-like protein with peptidoglycan-binding domain
MLEVLSNYIPEIPSVTIDGIYGTATRAAVLAAQRRFRLPETGVVDKAVWDQIYDQYAGIENTSLRSKENFPSARSNAALTSTTTMQQFPGFDISPGQQDPVRQEAIR